jgi:hypothetical protein
MIQSLSPETVSVLGVLWLVGLAMTIAGAR